MKVELRDEHRWLERLVGDWTFELLEPAEGERPPVRHAGTETVRSLGGVWVLLQGEGELHGTHTQSLMTLGYDPAKARFVGTWVGSPMAYLWIYDGTLDEARRVLTLETEGPSFAGDGKLARYRDVITLESDDHRTLTAHTQGPDGTWRQFMRTEYRRRR